MTSQATDPNVDVQRLCRLAGLPRATYYRHLAKRSSETAECELRDVIQRICLKHVFYGYRRVTAALRRQGMVVNAKKVQRLMRQDNLLAQRRTPFLKPSAERPSSVLVIPNLVRGLVPSAPIRSGSPTSPMSISPRPLPISPSFWMPSRARLSAGLLKIRSMPHSPSLHWRKPSTLGSRHPAA